MGPIFPGNPGCESSRGTGCAEGAREGGWVAVGQKVPETQKSGSENEPGSSSPVKGGTRGLGVPLRAPLWGSGSVEGPSSVQPCLSLLPAVAKSPCQEEGRHGGWQPLPRIPHPIPLGELSAQSWETCPLDGGQILTRCGQTALEEAQQRFAEGTIGPCHVMGKMGFAARRVYLGHCSLFMSTYHEASGPAA